MDPFLIIITSLIGYLIGSISFTRIIGKFVLPGEDLEHSKVQIEGTNQYFNFRSVSASTLRVQAGSKYGIIVTILDLLKASIPIYITLNFLDLQLYSYLISASIILGHDFPIFYKFRGGRGTSCLLGSLLFFDWVSIPVTLMLTMFIGLLVFNDIILPYLSMPIYLIPWVLFASGISDFLIYASVVNAIYWIAVAPDLREYLNFRKTVAYEQEKKARNERTKKKISKILHKLRIRK